MTISIRSGIPGTRICAPRKTPFSEHKKAEDLAQRFMPHRKHEKADELHRQHDGESEHDDRAGEIERDADAIGDGEGEDDGEGANDQARARLENHMDLAMDLHAADDPQNEIGQQQPAESRGEDRHDV